MSDLNIRNVDDSLIWESKRKAMELHLTLREFVIACLRDGLMLNSGNRLTVYTTQGLDVTIPISHDGGQSDLDKHFAPRADGLDLVPGNEAMQRFLREKFIPAEKVAEFAKDDPEVSFELGHTLQNSVPKGVSHVDIVRESTGALIEQVPIYHCVECGGVLRESKGKFACPDQGCSLYGREQRV